MKILNKKNEPIYVLALDDLFLRNKYQDKFNRGPTNFKDFTLKQEMELIHITAKLGVRATFFMPCPEPFQRAVKDNILLKEALKEVIDLGMEIGGHGYKHNDIDTAESYKEANKTAIFLKKMVFGNKNYEYNILIWRSPGSNWNKKIERNISKSGYKLHSDNYSFFPIIKIDDNNTAGIKWQRLVCDLPHFFKGGSNKNWVNKNKMGILYDVLSKFMKIAKVPLMHVWCQRGYQNGKVDNSRLKIYEEILKDKIRKKILIMPLSDFYLYWKYPVEIKVSGSKVILDNSKNNSDSVMYLKFDHHNKNADKFYVLEDESKYSIGRFLIKKGKKKIISLEEKKTARKLIVFIRNNK